MTESHASCVYTFELHGICDLIVERWYFPHKFPPQASVTLKYSTYKHKQLRYLIRFRVRCYFHSVPAVDMRRSEGVWSQIPEHVGAPTRRMTQGRSD